MRTVEDLLDELGGFGLFQLIIVLAVMCSLPSAAWSMLFMSIGGKVPGWYCEMSDAQENESLSENSTSFKACFVNGSRCEHYRYLGDTWTIVKEWNLVCDLKSVKATVTSIQMGGVFLGAFVAAQVADRFGRKKAFFATILLHGLANTATAFSLNWQMFAAGRFLIGSSLGGTIVTSFTFALEFLPVKWRALLGLIPFFSLSVASYGLVAYLVPDWVHQHLLTGITSFPVLFTYLWIPESARWLTVQGRVEEAVQVLRKVARTNGRQLPPDTRETLQAIADTERTSNAFAKKYTYMDLLRGRKVTRLTLAVCFIWFSACLIFYGISFGVSSLSGNMYINMAIMGLLDVPLILPVFCIANTWGRRWLIVIAYFIAGASAFTCLGFRLTLPESQSASYISALSLTARLMVSATWGILQAWTCELYPTVTRNLGFGVGNTVARVGSIIAPFVIDLDDAAVRTYILVGSMCVSIMALAFTLTETSGKVLKDGMTSAEQGAELMVAVPLDIVMRKIGADDEDQNGATPVDDGSVLETVGVEGDEVEKLR